MNKDKFAAMKNVLETLLRVVNRIEHGERTKSACDKENVNYKWFCNVLRRRWEIAKKKDEVVVSDKMRTWQERFIIDLLGTRYEPLEDFDEAFEIVVNSLTKREEKVVRMYYPEEQTFREIGDTFGMTGSNIQLILKKAMNKLKNPSRSDYFIYGIEDIQKFDKQCNDTELLRKEYTRLVTEAKAYRDCLSLLHDEIKKQSEFCKDNNYMSEPKITDMVRSIDNTSQKLLAIYDKYDLMKTGTPLSELNISYRTERVLMRNGIQTVEDLTKYDIDDLYNLSFCGKLSAQEIERAMHEFGVELGSFKCLRNRIISMHHVEKKDFCEYDSYSTSQDIEDDCLDNYEDYDEEIDYNAL